MTALAESFTARLRLLADRERCRARNTVRYADEHRSTAAMLDEAADRLAADDGETARSIGLLEGAISMIGTGAEINHEGLIELLEEVRDNLREHLAAGRRDDV